MSACIVQFPHPGPEHVPPGEWMGWNTGAHRRKFMVSRGTVMDDKGVHEKERQLVFWGEWEAPSRVVRRWPRQEGLATVLHEPYWEEPRLGGFRQNTDPWVLGDAFLYSNCKQLTPAKTPSALQRLPVGSLILFGSVRGDTFVLDTVFVVGEVLCSFTPLAGDLAVADPFRVCTIESLTTCEAEVAQASFTLYRGATPDDSVDGMFSFVPCLAGASARFRRPAIELPGAINPKSRQSPSGAKILRPLSEVKSAWSSVVDQVTEADLLLGYALDLPRLR
jgi:hypothetical protein